MKKLYMMLASTDQEMILKTIFRSGAERVCLICPEQKTHYRKESDLLIRKITDKLVAKLSELTVVDVLRFRFNDFDQAMASLVEYVKTHRNEYEITVNVSIGSHFVCAILQNVASLFHLRVQFTLMKELNPKLLTEEDWHYGFKEVVDLPTIPTDLALSNKEIKFLELLMKKKSMIVQDYIALFAKSLENRKRAEFSYYVDKFSKLQFVDVVRVSNRAVVSLNETGRLVLSIHG